MQVIPEQESDFAAVDALNRAAFDSSAEADLIRQLREQASPLISLVAKDDSGVIGHIMYSPVTLPSYPEARLMGLAPMAVLPERQRQGTGSALVEAGVAACREKGYEGIVVLGHPDYYPRFGFKPASEFNLDCEYDVPPEVFMALELSPESLQGLSGKIRYHPAFAAV